MAYHINPETLRPNLCKAQIQCQFKGSRHFDTKEEARTFQDEKMRDQDVPAPLKKVVIDPSIPPVSTDEELEAEEWSLNDELYGNSIKDLMESRRIDKYDVLDAEDNGSYEIDTKVPSHYEISFSTDLARKALGMKPRQKTAIDEDELRLAEIEMKAARKGTTGMFSSNEEARTAQRKYDDAREKFNAIKSARKQS